MQRSPLLDRHRSAGARLAARPEAPDRTTVLTFGNVPAEYRAGCEGALLLDASDAGALDVAGRDAASFLHRILANDVHGLAPGDGGANLLLSPKGKVQHLFDLWRDERGFELLTPPAGAAALAAALDLYLFGEDVRIEDATERSAALELVGPRADEVVGRALGTPPPTEPGRRLQVDAAGTRTTVARCRRYGSQALVLDGGPEAVAGLWDGLVEAGALPGGLVARDALRVEAASGLPGLDVSADVYPQEARLEHAFSLAKGCYVGQEVVAKIDTYGGLNKRLSVLAVEGDDPVPAGARLVREVDGEERDLGVVTSWAYSFALDGGAVLAYVKRRHQAPGTVFRVDGRSARLLEPPPRGGTAAPSGRP